MIVDLCHVDIVPPSGPLALKGEMPKERAVEPRVHAILVKEKYEKQTVV